MNLKPWTRPRTLTVASALYIVLLIAALWLLPTDANSPFLLLVYPAPPILLWVGLILSVATVRLSWWSVATMTMLNAAGMLPLSHFLLGLRDPLLRPWSVDLDLGDLFGMGLYSAMWLALPTLLIVAMSGVAHRRRTDRSRCRTCRYQLLDEQIKCPECGTVRAQLTPSDASQPTRSEWPLLVGIPIMLGSALIASPLLAAAMLDAEELWFGIRVTLAQRNGATTFHMAVPNRELYWDATAGYSSYSHGFD